MKNQTPNQTVSTVSGERLRQTKNTTLYEFIRWLYNRKQNRRRYSKDVRKRYRFSQKVSILLFVTMISFCFGIAVFFSDSNRTDKKKESGITLDHSVYTNPSLSQSMLLYAVSVKIGAEASATYYSPSMTVGDLLSDIGYTEEENDRIVPSPDTILSEGMEITVTHITFSETTQATALPFQTEYIDSQTIPRGSIRSIRAGEDGILETVTQTRYENGVAVSETVLSETRVTEPINAICYRGIGGVVYGESGTYAYSYYIDVSATVYTANTEPAYTYSGTLAREGVIAVDPSVIPLGTKVYVKGDYKDCGLCYAEDIGGGIKGSKIDIYMDAPYEELMEFGVREMRVYILE